MRTQRRTACVDVNVFTTSVCLPVQPLRLRGGAMTLARGRDPHEILGVARGAPMASVRAPITGSMYAKSVVPAAKLRPEAVGLGCS